MAKTRAETESDRVTIREVYMLIGDTQRSMQGSIDRLEQRLIEVEKNTANIQGRIMMVPTVISIAISIFGFLLSYVFIK